MKGLLLKEFYQWLKTRSVFTVAYTVLFAASIFTSEGRLRTQPAGILGVVFGLALNSFMLDEKSGWNEYSRSLPCSPFQRVTAKYIFFAPELMLICFAEMVFAIIPQKLSEDFYINSSPLGGYPEAIICFALWMICLSITLPSCILIKGNKKFALTCIPLFLTLIASTLAASKLRNSVTPEWLADITALKWFYPAVVLASVGIFVASWLITVAIEARGDKKYSLKFIKIAVVPVVVAVALSGVIGNAIYSNRDFIEEKNMRDSKGYKYISDIDEIADDYNDYYNYFCNEFHLGMTVSECAEKLENIDYFQNVNNPKKLYSKSGKINIDLRTEEETEKINSVFAYCNLAVKSIDGASSEDFADIVSNFNPGMKEAELHEKFNKLKLFPCDIHEFDADGNQPRRYYTLRFLTNNFNGEYDKSVEFKITIETDGNSVVDVVPNLFRHYDSTDETEIHELTETEETYLEKATREMTEFIASFCNETHIEETPRECIKKLKNIGYTESENTYDLYYSEGGKISVILVTNDEDKLEKITVIANYGEIRYKKTATEKEMKEFSDNFILGMTENQLQQKLIELEALPDSITECYTDKKEHLRSYEIKYRIGDYNNNGAVTYSLTVEVTDGKVTDIIVFDA